MTSIENEELRLLLIAMFRYSLGRMTYMPQEARELIKKNAHVLSPGDLIQFDQDIGSAAQRQALGSASDAEDWLEFRQWLRGAVTTARPLGSRPCEACSDGEPCAYCNGRGWVEASHPAWWPKDINWTVTHEVEALLETLMLQAHHLERSDETAENDRRSVFAAVERAFRIGQQRALMRPEELKGFVGGIYRHREVETAWVPPEQTGEGDIAYLILETHSPQRLFKAMTTGPLVFKEDFELVYPVRREA